MLDYLRDLGNQLDMGAIQAAAERVAAVFLCLTVHESCHGLAALALGDPTARREHRLSLNPLRHIDWFGLAMMFAAGFGWAKPVPVDPRYFKNPKWGMALTALAGPVSNFLLAVGAILAARGIYAVVPEGAPWAGTLWEGAFSFFLFSVAPLSIGLGVFNLLPFPPLDGSKVAAALLPDRLYLPWMRYERYGMAVLLAAVLLGWQADWIGIGVRNIYLFLFNLLF